MTSIAILFFLLTFSSLKKIDILQPSNLRATDDCKEKTFLPTEENSKILGRFLQKEG